MEAIEILDIYFQLNNDYGKERKENDKKET